MPNQITVQLNQSSPSTAKATIRSHEVLVDRPAAKGGADQGPMGGELFLAGIGGCFMSNLLAAIKAREEAISDVRIDVAGTLAETPARFTSVDLWVTAENASEEQFRKLLEIADRGCIMMNTLRAKLDIRIHSGALSSPRS